MLRRLQLVKVLFSILTSYTVSTYGLISDAGNHLIVSK